MPAHSPRFRRVPLVALFACGCAVHYALPMTAKELVRYNTGPALVAYLGQPDANPSVCDLRSDGPHLSELTPDIQNALMDGLVAGEISPVAWSRCTRALVKGLPDDRLASLRDAQARTYWKLLRSQEVELDPAVAERVAALKRVFLGRGDGRPAGAKDLGPVLAELREALANGKLGPIAHGFGLEMFDTLDVEAGRWHGAEITIATMDALAAAGNEMTLTRFAERLPTPELRKEASRRLVRIHIALSAFPEVHNAAPAVEERVVAHGNNSLSLVEHPLVRAWFDLEKTPIRGVLVREDVWHQAATLLGYSVDRPGLSVLPELSFRGALWAEVASISRPVSLCDSGKRFDPTPCVDAADVSLDSPFTYADRNGSFRFRDRVDMAHVVALAGQDVFALPVAIGGKPATTLHWQLAFERPEDLTFTGQSPGGGGPPVLVRVERPHPSHFVFTASSPQGTFRAVVQASDLGSFHVESAGGDGDDGASGESGSSGADGAECQDGGDGGDGGDGRDGGSGGDGGDVHVQIVCGQLDCQDTLARIQGVARSRGGPGGEGGSGGSGGSGGKGGSARAATTHVDSNGQTVVDDPGCSAGSSGSDGRSGSSGSDGQEGRPGHVTFEILR